MCVCAQAKAMTVTPMTPSFHKLAKEPSLFLTLPCLVPLLQPTALYHQAPFSFFSHSSSPLFSSSSLPSVLIVDVVDITRALQFHSALSAATVAVSILLLRWVPASVISYRRDDALIFRQLSVEVHCQAAFFRADGPYSAGRARLPLRHWRRGPVQHCLMAASKRRSSLTLLFRCSHSVAFHTKLSNP